MLPSRNVRLRSDPRAHDEAAGGNKIEKVLARRRVTTSSTDAPAYEYLVKYKSVSYLHVEWLSPGEILRRDRRYRFKLKRFVKEWLARGATEDDVSDVVDPSFIEVERIIGCKMVDRLRVAGSGRAAASAPLRARDAAGPDGASASAKPVVDGEDAGAGGGDGEGKAEDSAMKPPSSSWRTSPSGDDAAVRTEAMYFVKWAGLSYLECTWEWASDLGDTPKIAQFHRWAVPPADTPRLGRAGTVESAPAPVHVYEPRAGLSALPAFMQALMATVAHLGMKQKELAEVAGCSQATLSSWLSGRYRISPLFIDNLKSWLSHNLAPEWQPRLQEVMASVPTGQQGEGVAVPGLFRNRKPAPPPLPTLDQPSGLYTWTVKGEKVVLLPLSTLTALLSGRGAPMPHLTALVERLGGDVVADTATGTEAAPAAPIPAKAVEDVAPSGKAVEDVAPSAKAVEDGDAEGVDAPTVAAPPQAAPAVEAVDGAPAPMSASEACSDVDTAPAGADPADNATPVTDETPALALPPTHTAVVTTDGEAPAPPPAASPPPSDLVQTLGYPRRGEGFEPYTESWQYKNGRTLRQYQVAGLNWLLGRWHSRTNAILADEMGLGKTAQSVCLLEHLSRVNGLRGPYLIVVPLSTIQHWEREAEAWTDLCVCMYRDSAAARAVIREWEWYYPGYAKTVTKFSILLTTYEVAITDVALLAPIQWEAIIVDEGHRLKGAGSKLKAALRRLQTQFRLLLSGTPLQNNVQELWSLLNFIEPGKFATFGDFQRKFGVLGSAGEIQALQTAIIPHLLRRVKEEVEHSIPKKEETLIDVELTVMQKQYYRAIFEKNRLFLYRGCERSNLPGLANIEMQLRKTCNHPYLINGVEAKEVANMASVPVIDRLVACSGKMVLLDKFLPKLKEEGHRVLIFSQMVRMLDILEDYCRLREWPFERLDGNIKGVDRQAAIDRYCAPGSQSFVFLLSTRAGGLGINLTVADTVIIFDSDWNPQNDSQATARCHRIGQTQQVKVYRLITKNTYEATMFARATEKLSLEQAVLGGDASAMINTNKPRDANDIERMLRLGAASVMGQSLESGGGAAGGEDDAVAKAFMQSSIEDLLATHSRTIEIGETGVGFGSSEAEPVPTLDLNAEDFWEQVLPGFQSADKLLARLNDPDGPIQALKKATSKRDPERQERIEQRDEFVEDVAALVEFLCGKEGDVDRDSMLVMAKADVAAASKLLTLMTTLSSVFTSAQVALAEEWLAKLEGSRVRTCRAERVVGWAEVDEAASESDDSAGSDSVSEGDIFGAEAPPGPPEPDIVSDDEFDIMAEAVGDSDGSGDKKKGKGKAQKSMGEVWKSRKMNLGGPNAGMNDVCALCEDGGLLLVCDGLCNRAFHLPCVGLKAMPSSPEWLCPDCTAKAHLCLICGEVGSDVESKKEQALWLENDAKLVRKCCMKKCGRFYHHRCLLKIDMVSWVGTAFRCAQHYCCVCGTSGDGATLLQCTRCPVAYHMGCVPRSQAVAIDRLNRKAIVCPAHDDRAGVTLMDLLCGAKPTRNKPPGQKPGSNELYCVCQQPANGSESELWLACDTCNKWFHPGCVGVDPESVHDLESYKCDACSGGKSGVVVAPSPPPSKPRRAVKTPRRDVDSEEEEEEEEEEPAPPSTGKRKAGKQAVRQGVAPGSYTVSFLLGGSAEVVTTAIVAAEEGAKPKAASGGGKAATPHKPPARVSVKEEEAGTPATSKPRMRVLLSPPSLSTLNWSEFESAGPRTTTRVTFRSGDLLEAACTAVLPDSVLQTLLQRRSGKIVLPRKSLSSVGIGEAAPVAKTPGKASRSRSRGKGDPNALHCVCQQPEDPEAVYCLCETCGGWFHPECLGYTAEEAQEMDPFYCTECEVEAAAAKPKRGRA